MKYFLLWAEDICSTNTVSSQGIRSVQFFEHEGLMFTKFRFEFWFFNQQIPWSPSCDAEGQAW
jgi:hypothetical protein